MKDLYVIGIAVMLLALIALIAFSAFRRKNSRRKQEDAKAREMQEEKWTQQIKEKAVAAKNTCAKNSDVEAVWLKGTYYAGDEIQVILGELSEVTELQGRLAYQSEKLAGRNKRL